MAPDTAELGITGGEPTLLGPDLFRLIAAARDCLPATALHMLSNGRLSAYPRFVEQLAALRHPDLMIGVPLYSDLPEEHDFVVQARGAFDQTIRGLLNLGRFGIPIELRVVIHRQTCGRLPQLGEFIARNLPFVHQVALMGLEMMGYVKMNLDGLWIDPADYQPQLRECVEILDAAHVNTLIYNHQLCLLDRSLWPFARKSISDWKNIYMPECEGCSVRDQCGGFFASAGLRYSDQIRPVEALDTAVS
jgi:His-Xaa-Ser system radical SAM maturase HxsC